MQLKRFAVMVAAFISVALATPVASGYAQSAPSAATAASLANAAPADRMGSFQVKCRWSHSAPDDPIVAPGRRGAAHLHEFFGNVSTDANSTTRSLRNAGTSCVRPEDKAAYWAPSVYNRGERVRPNIMVSYYRTGALRDPSVIRPFPLGLRMIAGDGQATRPQPTVVTHWSCALDGPTGTSTPPASCDSDGSILRLRIAFPNCWDGKRLDSADHKSHMAYSYRHNRACPATHPVALPTLKLGFRYKIPGPLDRVSLSSGGQLTGHADFWNAWEPAAQRELVERCLHGAMRCDGPDL